MGAAQQLKRIFNEGFNATTPTDAASTTGSVAAMVKALVAQIIGTTPTSAVTADAAGSIVERLQYITDNTGIGLKKVANNGYELLPVGPSAGTAVATSASADTYGSYVQMRAATGNAIYIAGMIIEGGSYASTYVQVMIGTGTAASEVRVSEVKVSRPVSATFGDRIVMFPALIAVAANTRIAVKTAGGAGTESYGITLMVIDQANVVAA